MKWWIVSTLCWVALVAFFFVILVQAAIRVTGH